MNKKLLNALLCGVAILSVSVLASCKNDLSHVNSRLAALEGYYAEVQEQLAKALKEGNTVISYALSENGKNYVITLNNGQTISIPVGEGAGGGSSVTVDTSKPGFVTITVNDEPYTFAVGSAVTSLIYRPEFEDGYVALGSEDVRVKFLAAPAVSDVSTATFSVADVYEIGARPSTRAGNGELMSVPSGKGSLDGEFISVPLRALEVVGGSSYSVSIQMSLNGTVINSNYFTVKMDEGYVPKAEEIDETIIPDAKYSPVLNEDKSYTITVDGLEMLSPLNVKDFYGTTVPTGATFKVASAGKQPEGDAQGKQAMLAASLAADGTWEFTERPGTDFGANGFQIEVLVNDEVKARTNITINDELKDMDFTGGLLNDLQAEWGGRNKSVPLGASAIDMQASFFSYTPEGEGGDYDYPIIHGDRAGFFGKWPSFNVGEYGVILNNGSKLVLGELGEQYAVKSRGIYWFCRGFAIVAPEPLATTDGKYVDELGRGTTGGEITPNADWWGPQGVEFTGNGMMQQGLDRGFAISQDGVISFPDSYTGYGLRLGIGACYEYAYGVKKLGVGDQFGLFFFNRRMAPEGATMPPAIP